MIKYIKGIENRYNYDLKLLDEKGKNVTIIFPDSWYILPNETLYNTECGHKGSLLVIDEKIISHMLKKGWKVEPLYEHYIELREKIVANGFSEKEFNEYISYDYKTRYLDETHDVKTSHDENILNHIISIIDAKIYFYKFFNDLQKYTADPYEEYKKIIHMTNDNITDILVRCCHFHKIESKMDNMITTSCVDYEDEFIEYIERGYKIEFVLPIMINKEKGIIEEYPKEFIEIKKLLKK